MSDKRRENAEKYLSDKWNQNSLLDVYQVKAMKESLRIFQDAVCENGVSVVFMGQKLVFDCLERKELNVGLKFEDMGDPSLRGTMNYETNTIHINKRMNDGVLTYANIAHEFTHKLEHALVNHIAEYDKNSLEYQYLHLLEQQVNASKQKIKCFGIETHERLYFQPHMYVSYKQNKFVEPMYQLQISERNAKEVQEKALEYLEKTFDLNLEKYKTTELNDAVEEINKIYGSDWTNDELYQIIDNALMCVATDTAPSQYADMTATLAYEMVTMLYGDVAMRGEMDEKIEIYSNMIRQDEMSLRLRDSYENAYAIYKSGFRNTDWIVLHELDEGHIEYWQSLSTRTLETMSKKEQISNPRYVATVIAIEGAEAAKPYLKDFDSVKHWMFDNFENLSENMIMEIGNALEIDVVEEYLRYTKTDYVVSNPENIHFCDSILKESFDFIGNVNYEEVEFEITR